VSLNACPKRQAQAARRPPGFGGLPKTGSVAGGCVRFAWLPVVYFRNYSCNDPSAGSPTETLLRLLLPLNEQV
jgi:hypothetical protein